LSEYRNGSIYIVLCGNVVLFRLKYDHLAGILVLVSIGTKWDKSWTFCFCLSQNEKKTAGQLTGLPGRIRKLAIQKSDKSHSMSVTLLSNS